MPYATAADLRQRFASSEIACLDEDGDDRLTGALADASAEVDAHIHDLYELPLPAGPWSLLRAAACDLARQRLYDDEAPDTVRNAADRARKRLRELASGATALVDEAGRRAPRRPLVQATAPEPVMTRDALVDA